MTGVVLEKPLVEEVWDEKRRLGFELFGGDGVETVLGKMVEDVVRVREWEDEATL
jgi:hypothetical protein